MKTLLGVLLIATMIGCEPKSGESSSGSSIDGINMTGTWVPDSPFIACYTDSSLSAIDSMSDLHGTKSWQIVVSKNNVVETLSQSDCTLELRYKGVFENNNISFSDMEVEASPSPCLVSMQYDDLVDVTAEDFNYSTGQAITDYNLTAYLTDAHDKIILRASDMEAGSNVCVRIFTKQ